MGKTRGSSKQRKSTTNANTRQTTTNANARQSTSNDNARQPTTSGQKRSSREEGTTSTKRRNTRSNQDEGTTATKRRNTRSNLDSLPRPLTTDDISSIVTAVVQALPGRSPSEIPIKRGHSPRDSGYLQSSDDVTHSSRDDEEPAGPSSANNPNAPAPHNFGK